VKTQDPKPQEMKKESKPKEVQKESKSILSLQHVLIGLVAVLIAYQISTMQKMVQSIESLESRLRVVEIYMNAGEHSIKKGHLYDIPTHAPHAGYLKNIPTQANDSRIPLDPLRTYSYDDFESIFEVKPLHVQVLTEQAKELLGDHDPKTDQYFSDFKEEIMENYEDFTKYIDQGSHEQEDRERYEIKWASIQSGFGLFAKKDIKEGEIVGLYTGEVTADVDNTDYMWDYLTSKVGDKEVSLGLDARLTGNYFRFVNHIGDEANTKPFFIPYNNQWYVFYVCVKDIKAGEELTTDYGEAYFATRAEQ
jgi:hypothetical protein